MATETIESQRAAAFVDLCHGLLARYVEVFPNYAYTDPQCAIDLMAAEIITLREELRLARTRGDSQ
jgi:hypothetical protein